MVSMKSMKRSTLLWLAFGLVLIPGRAGWAGFSAEGSFERTLQVDGPAVVDVTTGSGSIHIQRGPAGAVRVKGRIRASSWSGVLDDARERIRRLEENPPIEQTGNTIHIGRVVDQRDESLSRDISISYEIFVPEATLVESRTGSGSQTIEGIRGPLSASAGSGSIEVASVQGGLRARAGSGEIEARNVEGFVRATTGSGSLNLEQVHGDVEAETGSGSIEVRGLRGRLSARSGSGSIRAEGTPDGEWRLRSSSGTVRAELPVDAEFDFYCRTSSGSIHTDFPITVQGRLGKKELQGRVRGGGPLLHVSTASGSVYIESSTRTEGER